MNPRERNFYAFISFWRYFSIHLIISSFISIIFQQQEIWPSIDSLAPINAMLGKSELGSELDIFTKYSISNNGKTPFLEILHFICAMFGINSIICISILSTLTSAITLPAMLLALYYGMSYRSGTKISSKFFYVSLAPTVLYPIWIKIPGLYFAGFGPFFGPWVTPTLYFNFNH
jgi:hypothetical protein